MTVTYSAEVATSKGFGCFWKLLFRWRGSIYKLLWPDLVFYFSFYYILSLLYRFALEENQKRFFEKVSLYCSTYGDLIPVSFVLGFYVSLVVKRWWDSFNCIPWPDSLAFFVSAFIHGQDDRGRLMRRTIMRYVNLAFVFTLTCISPCVKKRFPTMDHLVEAGILLPNEKKIIDQMKTTHSTYWMPLVWASSIATRARKEGRIRDDFALKTVIDAIAHYRSLCGGLFNYDWISIPLVYTQVVTLVVYTFFLATLMGRQYLDPEQGYKGYKVDLYIPVFNFLQFFFYMGWLKVAETLVNPFGEDDDDFEVNWVIDRDIQVSYLIVDEMHQEHPELIKDQYWDEVMPDLPYTAAAMQFYTEAPQGSAATITVPAHEAEFVPLETLTEGHENEQLEEVRVGAINQPIPMVASEERKTRLSRNMSESTHSSNSGFGRSFHPHSQQKKSVMSLLHRLFSKDSAAVGSTSSLQSQSSKQLRKSLSKESNICASPSCPPSPTDSKYQMHAFPDDIFHLSDLSLAESRAASIVQSPGVLGNFQVTDLFNRLRADHQTSPEPPQTSLKPPANQTAEMDSSDEDQSNGLTKKNSRTSLRKFFKSGGKMRNTQKSFMDSCRSGHRKTSSTATDDTESILSCNQLDISDTNSGMLEPDSNDFFNHRRGQISLSSQVSRDSPKVPQDLKLELSNISTSTAKEPSTHTLIASDDELSSSSDEITEILNIKDGRNISYKESPLPPKKMLARFHPKRTVSLHIYDANHSNKNSNNLRHKQHSEEAVNVAGKTQGSSLKMQLKSKKNNLLKKLNKSTKNASSKSPLSNEDTDENLRKKIGDPDTFEHTVI